MLKKLFNSGIFWTIIVGLIGVVLTIVFYEFSNKTRELVYSILKEPTLIYDRENASSNFKLISADSTLIQDNVYVSTILVWNNGDLEIEKDDIRKEIKVIVLNNGKILDYKITRETNPEIGKFKLKKIENELLVDWDYFDPNFGFEFQVIYSGAPETQIEMDGYILGTEVKKVILRPNGGFFKYFIVILLGTQFLLAFLVFKDFERSSLKYYLFQSCLILMGLISVFWLVNKYFLSGFVSPF